MRRSTVQAIDANMNRVPEPIRYDGAVNGKMYLDKWHDTDRHGHLPNIVTRRVTPEEITFIGDRGANFGDKAFAYLPDLGGLVRGTITRPMGAVLTMRIEMDDNSRARLAANILWLDRRASFRSNDGRQFPRFQPKNPASYLELAPGHKVPCNIVDISPIGAGVMCERIPPMRHKLLLGKILGEVVRHTKVGFGMQFTQVQDPRTLEEQIAVPDDIQYSDALMLTEPMVLT